MENGKIQKVKFQGQGKSSKGSYGEKKREKRYKNSRMKQINNAEYFV